jgi:hypothetical protein
VRDGRTLRCGTVVAVVAGCFQTAPKTADEEAGTGGEREKGSGALPSEAGDLIEDVSGFALLQLGRHGVSAVTGLVDEIGGHAGLLGTLSHCVKFLAQRAQTTCYPLLLIRSLLGEFTSGLAHQLLDLLRRFGGHLPGLLACYAGDVFAGIACRAGDLSGLILRNVGGGGLLTLRAGSTLRAEWGDPCRVTPRHRVDPTDIRGIAGMGHELPFFQVADPRPPR